MNHKRFNIKHFETIAEFQAKQTDNTEELRVVVREYPAQGLFTVHVEGGLLSTGEEVFNTYQIRVAMTRAAIEIAEALDPLYT